MDESPDVNGQRHPLPQGWMLVPGSQAIAGQLPHGRALWFRLLGAPLIIGITSFTRGDGGRLVGIAELALAAAAVAVISAFLARGRRLEVNLETAEFRLGPNALPLAELVRATLTAAPNRPRSPYLALTLGPQKGRTSSFVVRTARGATLPPTTTALLVATVRRSGIEVPSTPDDPEGRFARYNFPGALTKEETLRVLLTPPGPDDPLPIAGSTPLGGR